jgi:hypothetical protein
MCGNNISGIVHEKHQALGGSRIANSTSSHLFFLAKALNVYISECNTTFGICE